MSAAGMRFDAWDQDALCAAMLAAMGASGGRMPPGAAGQMNLQPRAGISNSQRVINTRRRVVAAILAGCHLRREIAAQSGLGIATVTQSVQRMEMDGLLRREPGGAGMCGASRLVLTQEGLDWVAENSGDPVGGGA
ncbi:hypothetical protein SAMN04488103_109173 [Gemmobacter aquatilis]|uniref:Uncharacterized protein n=1 Tax=Gemmobacter aquatilis TaxID=933059 RepID=A0A1H8KQN2_9RHOB|nr:hypothetical protein [Gemmobacter aquatilis]SEN95209.1 hypothetical protein SAMN04488103_109173 [Gemmobacter aquatilis]